MSEENRDKIEDIVRTYTSDGTRKTEIDNMRGKQGSKAFRDFEHDPMELYRQLGKRLLQIQDGDILKQCGLALFRIWPWPLILAEP